MPRKSLSVVFILGLILIVSSYLPVSMGLRGLPVGVSVETVGYPSSGSYYFFDSYKLIPAHGLLVFTAWPPRLEEDNLGCIYAYSLNDHIGRCLYFLDTIPLQPYVFGNYLIVVGEVYGGSGPLPSIRGLRIYTLSLGTLDIKGKDTVEIGGGGPITPYRDILPLSPQSFLLPLSSMVEDGESYNVLFRVNVGADGSINVLKVFDVKADYHDYTLPEVHGDYILWGPYVIDRGNYALIDDLRGGANSTHVSMILNNTYVFTRYYDYPGYNKLEVIYYSLTNRSVVLRKTLYVYNKSSYEYSLLDAEVFRDRYILVIIDQDRRGFDVFLPNSLTVYSYDAQTMNEYFIGNFTGMEYYTGRYRGYELLLVAGEGNLTFIDPASHSVVSREFNVFKKPLGSLVGLGQLIITSDPNVKGYRMIILPIEATNFYIATFTYSELGPLPEPWITPLLLACIISTYIILHGTRRPRGLVPHGPQ